MNQVIVIGSGIAGIASAIRLRMQGFDVQVFESAATYGGKIAEYRANGFRFDGGPSLFTLPQLVDELFTLAGKDPRNYFNYVPLQNVTRYFFSNNQTLDVSSDPRKFAHEASRVTGVPVDTIDAFLNLQRDNYERLAPIFIEEPIHLPGRIFKFKHLPALKQLLQTKVWKTMDGFNGSHFKNEALTQLFNRYGTYNGSNPYKMSALFNLIAHLEHNQGAFMPIKGMRSIVDALFNLAKDLGVEFHFNAYVNEIKVQHNHVVGVMVNSDLHEANLVISNMDVFYTYTKLLPNQSKPNLRLKQPRSNSALIFQWGMNGTFDQLDVHNILFAEDYQQEFNAIFKDFKIHTDPTVYIYISSKLVEGDAPKGKENWFVMINVPHLAHPSQEVNWIADARQLIKQKIERRLGIRVDDYIELEHVLDPKCIQDNTHAHLGSLYGNRSDDMMAAFWRHPNFASVRGLYMVGGTAHPGGGIPLCLNSAKITAQLIQERYYA